MDIVKEIFVRSTPLFSKLIPYGFIKKEAGYTFKKLFFDDKFEAVISISNNGIITSNVIDKEFDEEFYQINVESFTGGYIGSVREAYKGLLIDIRNSCFKQEIFISNQANRIASLIKERYDEEPDYPFSDMENYGVFRYPKNKKWYGLIMNIRKGLLYKDDNQDNVDIINIKLDELTMKEALNKEGIFPAYHMNHKYWVSITLDETLNDDEIMFLIDISRNLIINSKKASKK